MVIVEGSAGFARWMDAPAAAAGSGGDVAPPAPRGVSLTVGNFDGVHLGHRELLRRAVERAREKDLLSAALTFSPHPIRFFSPQARFYEITSPGEKAALIGALGIDALIVEAFDGGVGEMTPEEFVREIVHRRIRARHVTVGYDFTFGRRRTGSPALFKAVGRELGIAVDVVAPVVRGGFIVSSTRVRELILAGRVREAGELLCRPYRLSGCVVRGAERGRKLGFPTANLAVAQELIPLPGVYVVDAGIGGRAWKGVANVGFNPTFGENSLGVEVHVLDFAGDLYGQGVDVFFRERIRDEKKFKSADELVRQIEKDVRYARGLDLPSPAEKGARGGRRSPAGEAAR